MKNEFLAVFGLIGAFISSLFGGWSTALATLVIFMGIDYAMGLIVAGVFHASKKSENGCLESHAGWKGLVRKGITLTLVLVAYRLDLMIGESYIKDAVSIAFVANEAISIIENASLMGIKVPKFLMKAIGMLKEKSGLVEESQ